MGVEIEHKFLVTTNAWRAHVLRQASFRQGYLSTAPARSVRVRATDQRAFLTIKGRSVGATRAEYEYDIPLADALEILQNLCEQPIIIKTRHYLQFAGNEWVVDEFFMENAGLVLAEIELTTESQSFAVPDWAGADVTADLRYTNASLSRHPYAAWRKSA